jgi:hypothetical protein
VHPHAEARGRHRGRAVMSRGGIFRRKRQHVKALPGGRQYRVTGASSRTGEDVEITVEAFDEADAARAANRQGVFVSGCVAAGPSGSDWATAAPSRGQQPAPAPAPAAAAPSWPTLAAAPVVQRLVRTHRSSGPLQVAERRRPTDPVVAGRAGHGDQLPLSRARGRIDRWRGQRRVNRAPVPGAAAFTSGSGSVQRQTGSRCPRSRSRRYRARGLSPSRGVSFARRTPRSKQAGRRSTSPRR